MTMTANVLNEHWSFQQMYFMFNAHDSKLIQWTMAIQQMYSKYNDNDSKCGPCIKTMA